VRADGTLGGFVTGRTEDKARALRREGVGSAQGRVDLPACRFCAFRGPQPLQRLERLQQELRSHLRLSGRTRFHRIAGVDVSYQGPYGYAAYVEVEPTSRELVCSIVASRRVEFPYVSSYLAFRELPILLDLLQQVQAVRPLADLLMVDGSGIAHPRRMGLATMLGIATTVATVGITKKLLSGQVNLSRIRFGDERQIRDSQQELIGVATLPWSRTGKPIYVSPGHLVSVAQASRLVRQYLGERRLPDPIYWADRISRGAAKSSDVRP
jgi:deoxyribonuclease V